MAWRGVAGTQRAARRYGERPSILYLPPSSRCHGEAQQGLRQGHQRFETGKAQGRGRER